VVSQLSNERASEVNEKDPRTQAEPSQAEAPRRLAKVVIEVLGGVAEVTSNPDNVEVEIIDHDNEEAEVNGL
jgi:hypothetical protein